MRRSDTWTHAHLLQDISLSDHQDAITRRYANKHNSNSSQARNSSPSQQAAHQSESRYIFGFFWYAHNSSKYDVKTCPPACILQSEFDFAKSIWDFLMFTPHQTLAKSLNVLKSTVGKQSNFVSGAYLQYNQIAHSMPLHGTTVLP
jgi:hypothetical protein